MNKWIVILIILLAGSRLAAQPVVPTPETLYSDAVEFIYSGDYRDALDVLQALYKRGYRNANINYLIGESYLNINGQKTKAIPYLKDAVANISENYKGEFLSEEYAPAKALLYLGIAYRLHYEFDNAIHYFSEYIRTLDDSDKSNRTTAEYHIERCNYARELIDAPAIFTADTISSGLNPATSYFNPVAASDERALYFMAQLKFYDAVMQASVDNLKLSAPVNLTPEIRSDGDHFITGASADGKKLFFTYYDPYLSGEIYISDYVNGIWTPLYKAGNDINTVYNESHASLSPDGNVMYFVSDRKGGYGGTDIYKSVKNQAGEWGKPVNLGPLINSPFNEESPFVSSDGSRLFFSSQGHYNMGGYDVFYCAKDQEGNWLPPVNIGYPLNTTDDDVFFYPVADGNSGFQARYAANSAVSDLVHFKISSFGKPERYMINGRIGVTNEADFDKTAINVSIIETDRDDTLAVKKLNEDGSFRQKVAAGNYRIDLSDEQKLLLSKIIRIPDYFPHNNLVISEEVEVFTATATSDTVFLRNILFEFNNTKPSEEFNRDIETLIAILLKYPEATVTLSGYADALGGEDFNRRLSMKRAVSIKDILEGRIEKTLRIITQGFGENNPVATNTNRNGTDNPEGRKYNRRVEVTFENLPDRLHVIRVNEVPEDLRIR